MRRRRAVRFVAGRWRTSAEVAAQRLPVHFLPSALEVLARIVGKSGMVEREFCPGTIAGEFEADDRVNPLRPIAGAPSLDDALVGQHLDVAACDHAAEH